MANPEQIGLGIGPKKGRVRGTVFHFRRGKLGQSHLNCSREDFEEVIFLPSGLELFGMDATFGSFLLFEQVEGNVPQDSQVFRSLILAYPTVIFVHGYIQDPVQFIFNGPMSADNMQ